MTNEVLFFDEFVFNIFQNVIFVMSCQTGGKFHQSLQRYKTKELVVEALDMWDKAEMVRSHLAIHRKVLDESPFNNQVQ